MLLAARHPSVCGPLTGSHRGLGEFDSRHGWLYGTCPLGPHSKSHRCTPVPVPSPAALGSAAALGRKTGTQQIAGYGHKMEWKLAVCCIVLRLGNWPSQAKRWQTIGKCLAITGKPVTNAWPSQANRWQMSGHRRSQANRRQMNCWQMLGHQRQIVGK
jgi:hypothetical protein